MHTIEVDFEVLKALMVRRASEDVSNNDVIRDLLKLPRAAQKSATNAPTRADWVVKGIRFPAGMDFRSKHQGRGISARVEDGALVLNGKSYDSPSAAAYAVTGYAVNGWVFWECRTPGGEWRQMSTYRKGE